MLAASKFCAVSQSILLVGQSGVTFNAGLNRGQLVACVFTAAANGVGIKFKLELGGAAGSIKAAVYSWTSNGAGSKLSGEVEVTVSAVQTSIEVTIPSVTITSGTKYNLVFNTSANSMVAVNSAGGTMKLSGGGAANSYPYASAFPNPMALTGSSLSYLAGIAVYS